MSSAQTLSRPQSLALAVHAAGLIAALAVTWLAFADIAAGRQTLRLARETLAQLNARAMAVGGPASGATDGLKDPFLGGDTVTVAGANLQERVVAAIRRAGGAVTSSQVDLSDPKATPQRIALSAASELEQSALQGLLYDLEAGAPYLYLDQISVQSARENFGAAAGTADATRLRISLSVSAYWRGGKP
jgi:general secretion pathway protein M